MASCGQVLTVASLAASSRTEIRAGTSTHEAEPASDGCSPPISRAKMASPIHPSLRVIITATSPRTSATVSGDQPVGGWLAGLSCAGRSCAVPRGFRKARGALRRRRLRRPSFWRRTGCRAQRLEQRRRRVVQSPALSAGSRAGAQPNPHCGARTRAERSRKRSAGGCARRSPQPGIRAAAERSSRPRSTAGRAHRPDGRTSPPRERRTPSTTAEAAAADRPPARRTAWRLVLRQIQRAANGRRPARRLDRRPVDPGAPDRLIPPGRQFLAPEAGVRRAAVGPGASLAMRGRNSPSSRLWKRSLRSLQTLDLYGYGRFDRYFLVFGPLNSCDQMSSLSFIREMISNARELAMHARSTSFCRSQFCPSEPRRDSGSDKTGAWRRLLRCMPSSRAAGGRRQTRTAPRLLRRRARGHELFREYPTILRRRACATPRIALGSRTA